MAEWLLDELIALYLVTHPEEDEVDNIACLWRCAAWCYAEGYISREAYESGLLYFP